MAANMNMIDYTKKVVLENYANFNGRADRPEYWWFFLFSFLVSIGLNIVGAIIHLPLISSIWSLAVLIPSIAVGVRRMHDVGKSGWFLLIPIYNLILACTEGQPGPNEYGPDPKNPIAQSFDFEEKTFEQ